MKTYNETFLQSIWKPEQPYPHRNFGFVALKPKDGRWEENAVALGATAEHDALALLDKDRGDCYFSPLTFSRPHRREKNVKTANVLFADLDNEDSFNKLSRLPAPHWLIHSGSPGHLHAYWFVKQEVPILEWKQFNKGVTAYIEADPAGWDTTQVLRVPFTTNWKTGRKVSVAEDFSHMPRYDIGAFPRIEGLFKGGGDLSVPVPVSLPADQRKLLVNTLRKLGHITEEDRFLLLMDKSQRAFLPRDRSKWLWGYFLRLREKGVSAELIFKSVSGAYVDKWRYQPERLWDDILRSA